MKIFKIDLNASKATLQQMMDCVVWCRKNSIPAFYTVDHFRVCISRNMPSFFKNCVMSTGFGQDCYLHIREDDVVLVKLAFPEMFE